MHSCCEFYHFLYSTASFFVILVYSQRTLPASHLVLYSFHPWHISLMPWICHIYFFSLVPSFLTPASFILCPHQDSDFPLHNVIFQSVPHPDDFYFLNVSLSISLTDSTVVQPIIISYLDSNLIANVIHAFPYSFCICLHSFLWESHGS